MNILLITTSPNGILDNLQGKFNVCLSVVDCKQYIEDADAQNKQVVKTNILSAIKDSLDNLETDIILTYRCPCILPVELFSRAKYVALNIHPSLLPKYAGANPWIEIYKNKEKESGVTVHRIDEGIDTGVIIFQRKFQMDLNKDIKWHRRIVEEYACQILDDVFYALDEQNAKIVTDIIIVKDRTKIHNSVLKARRFMAAGFINDKLGMSDKSLVFYKNSMHVFSLVADYYESIEDNKKALEYYVFIHLLCTKAYGQNDEHMASCYEHTAVLQAKMGMEDKAMNSQRKANEIRERIYGFSHEQYIQGLQNFGLLGFYLGEYKKRKG